MLEVNNVILKVKIKNKQTIKKVVVFEVSFFESLMQNLLYFIKNNVQIYV